MPSGTNSGEGGADFDADGFGVFERSQKHGRTQIDNLPLLDWRQVKPGEIKKGR